MIKDIIIGDHSVRMAANAATAYRYKQLFGGDLMKIFQKISKSKEADIDLFSELAYVMAMQGAGKADQMSMDGYYRWLEDFGPFDIAHAASDIISLYTDQRMPSVESKKKAPQQSAH